MNVYVKDLKSFQQLNRLKQLSLSRSIKLHCLYLLVMVHNLVLYTDTEKYLGTL